MESARLRLVEHHRVTWAPPSRSCRPPGKVSLSRTRIGRGWIEVHVIKTQVCRPGLCTGPAIGDDFERFIGSDGYPLTELRTDLLAWAARLALAPADLP
jgi:hypothetical protein